MIHAPAANKKKKVNTGQLAFLEQKTGGKGLRGEWNTVVDGYQAVEHERCFFVQGE
jgi:hypothetical protein